MAAKHLYDELVGFVLSSLKAYNQTLQEIHETIQLWICICKLDCT